MLDLNFAFSVLWCPKLLRFMILTFLIYVFHNLWSVNCSMQHQKLVVLIVVRGVEVEVDNTSLAENLFPVQTLAPNFEFSHVFQLESSSLRVLACQD